MALFITLPQSIEPRMSATYLVIHTLSFRSVMRAADYIAGALRRYSRYPVNLRVCGTIGDAKIVPNSIVFIIGDAFLEFPKPSGCTYVFINFSLLSAIGPIKRYSQAARHWIAAKAAALASKAAALDFILDIYPEQAPLLRDALQTPVLPFRLGVTASARLPGPALYDVCVVGEVTPRREVVLRRLRRLGLSLSPTHGVVLEDVAVRSKVVLNLQAFRSLNVETPRIIGSLLSGAVLVCETNEALARSIPPHLYRQADYCEISAEVARSVSAYTAPTTAGGDWVRSIYLPACDDSWREVVEEIEGR